MPELSAFSWFLMSGATGVGISKSGLAGVSLIHVIVFAHVFGAKASTGALLPLLIVGDWLRCLAYRKRSRLAIRPPFTPTSVCWRCYWLVSARPTRRGYLQAIDRRIIILLCLGQLIRMWRPTFFTTILTQSRSHGQWVSWVVSPRCWQTQQARSERCTFLQSRYRNFV